MAEMSIAQPMCLLSQLTQGNPTLLLQWSLPYGADIVHYQIGINDATATVLIDGWSVINSINTTYTPSNPIYDSSNWYWVKIIAHNNATGDYSPWSAFMSATLLSTPAPSVPSNIHATYNGLVANITFTKGSNASSTALNFNGSVYYTDYSSISVVLPTSGQYYDISMASINSKGDYSSWVTLAGALHVASVPSSDPPTEIYISYGTYPWATMYFTQGNYTTKTVVKPSWTGVESLITGDYNYYTFQVPAMGTEYTIALVGVNSNNVRSVWTVSPTIIFPLRPSNFYGSLYYTLADNNDVISVAQWTTLAARVNEFRRYKGYDNYSFYDAWNSYAGNNFTANHFNEMLNAMSAVCYALPTGKNSGDNVYKSYFDSLVTSLNNIF